MSIHRTILGSAVSALGLLALLIAPFTTNTLGAAEGSMVMNTTCLMCGKPVDPSKTVPMTIGEGADAKHYSLAFCSDECCADFKKDPAAALKPWFIGPKGGDIRKGK